MKELNQEGEIIRLYLLGNLDSEARQSFEERLLGVPEVLDELLRVEDELVDDYLEKSLTEPERQQFETHFLATPERRQKLTFARSFRKYVSTNTLSPVKTPVDKPDRSGWKSWLADFFRGRGSFPVYATASVLVFAGVALWLWQSSRLQTHSTDQAIAELNRTPGLPVTAMSVRLAPGLIRDSGSGVTRIEISADVTVVQLQLEVAATPYQSYRATLHATDSGAEDVSINDLKSTTLDGRLIVPLKLPAQLLSRGDYDLNLSGVNSSGQSENIGRYSFRVPAR